MRCIEFERRIHKLLDEHPDGATCSDELSLALEVHASACEECRGLLAGYRQLFAGLAAISQPMASARFVDRVISQATPRGRFSYTRWVTCFATAASILIVLSLAIAARNPIRQPFAPRLPVATATPHAVKASLVNVEPVSPPASVALVPIRSRFDLDQASFGVVLNLAGLSPVTFSAEVLEAHLAQQPAWMVEVADGLKPVTESMTGTLNALRRRLPGNNDPDDHNQGARYERYSRYDRLA